MNLRRAAPDDAAMLAAIAFASKAHWGYSPAQLDAWRADLSPTGESLASQPAWVAWIDGEAAGFYQLVFGGGDAELEHLWVHPAFMRRGVGTYLLSHARVTAAAQGVAGIAIDADPSAEAFYLAMGAVRTALVAAPTDKEPARVRPQLRLSL